jgi:hypothetical protein
LNNKKRKRREIPGTCDNVPGTPFRVEWPFEIYFLYFYCLAVSVSPLYLPDTWTTVFQDFFGQPFWNIGGFYGISGGWQPLRRMGFV